MACGGLYFVFVQFRQEVLTLEVARDYTTLIGHHTDDWVGYVMDSRVSFSHRSYKAFTGESWFFERA